MSALLAFDRASARSVDENGFLHVSSSHITKATVNPYHGREIPGWEEAGLDPDAIYYGYRDPAELQKSLRTWEGLPLHIEHHTDSADAPAKLTRVGAVGKAVWNAPYVDAPLTVWDGTAIDAIESGAFRELSCAYRYDPDFTPGQHDGIEYDFVMRNIRGNHVALVEEGRAGADVVVADKNPFGADTQFDDTEHPRDEDGKFTSGGSGQSATGGPDTKEDAASGASRPVTITGNELGSYSDIKELRRKAVDYYKTHFQGKDAYRKDIGKIRFSRKGSDETVSHIPDRDKLLIVPALRDIIETGRLGKEEPKNHPRTDGIVAFVPVTKTINFKGKPREVEALLGKDRYGNLYYDLFLDGKRKKESPASGWEQNPRLAGDSPFASGLQLAGVTSVASGPEPHPGLAGIELNIRLKPSPVKGEEVSGAQDGCRTWVLTFDDRQSFPLPYAGKKKERLGGHGKFSQDTCLRTPGLVFSRPGMGAKPSHGERIGQNLAHVNDSGMARDQKTHTLKGVIMGKLKSLLRGARGDTGPPR